MSSASTDLQVAVDGSSSSSPVDSSQVRPWVSAVHCRAQDLFRGGRVVWTWATLHVSRS